MGPLLLQKESKTAEGPLSPGRFPCRIQVFALISAPHLGQVMTIFPLPAGTRQMVPQLLQVKYLCSLSA